MRSIQTLLGHENLNTTAITTRRFSTNKLALRLLASLYWVA
jgi:site-specific recombinase XerC